MLMFNILNHVIYLHNYLELLYIISVTTIRASAYTPTLLSNSLFNSYPINPQMVSCNLMLVSQSSGETKVCHSGQHPH